MATLTNHDFERFVLALGSDITVSSPNSFEMVLEDDLCAKVVLPPDEKLVIVEVFVCDMAMLVGAVRRAVINALLSLNSVGLRGQNIVCGLDSRDFVTLHCRTSLTELDAERFANMLDYLFRQARRVRELVRNLSFQGAEMTYSLEPAINGGAA